MLYIISVIKKFECKNKNCIVITLIKAMVQMLLKGTHKIVLRINNTYLIYYISVLLQFSKTRLQLSLFKHFIKYNIPTQDHFSFTFKLAAKTM